MNMSDQYVPQGLDSIRTDQLKGCLWKLCLETGVLRILYGVFIRIPHWSLSTSIHCTRSSIPSTLATTVGHLLYTEVAHHSKYALHTAYRQVAPVRAFHCDPTNLRTVRSSRDTPHRLAYS